MTATDRTLRLFFDAAETYWPMHNEMLAVIAETLHSLLLVTAKAYGATNLPPPLEITRPSQRAADTQISDPEQPPPRDDSNVIGFKQFASMLPRHPPRR